MDINGQTRLVKNYQRFGLIHSRLQAPQEKAFDLSLNHWYRLHDGDWIKVIKGYSTRARAWWDLNSLAWPLRVRASRPSDLIRLKNGGHQKVRRILIDQKVPNYQRRGTQVLLTQQGQILSLLKYKSSVLPLNRQKNCYSLLIKKGN